MYLDLSDLYLSAGAVYELRSIVRVLSLISYMLDLHWPSLKSYSLIFTPTLHSEVPCVHILEVIINQTNFPA